MFNGLLKGHFKVNDLYNKAYNENNGLEKKIVIFQSVFLFLILKKKKKQQQMSTQAT